MQSSRKFVSFLLAFLIFFLVIFVLVYSFVNFENYSVYLKKKPVPLNEFLKNYLVFLFCQLEYYYLLNFSTQQLVADFMNDYSAICYLDKLQTKSIKYDL